MARTDLYWGDFDNAFDAYNVFKYAAEELHAYRMKNYLNEETQDMEAICPDAWIFVDSPASADELREFVRNDKSIQELVADLRAEFEAEEADASSMGRE